MKRPRRLCALALATLWFSSAGPLPIAFAQPGTCVVRGHVVRAGDNSPIPYANVMALGTGVGTMTDSTGAFVLARLPPGRLFIKVERIGDIARLETVDLAPGDTVERIVYIPVSYPERISHARDSLMAIGLWPPRLDPVLAARMRGARHVRVFRLDPEAVYPLPADTSGFVRWWRIVGEVRKPAREAVDSLLAVFADSTLYLQDLKGEIKACGGFQPGIAVRYLGDGPGTDLLLCFKCGEFSIRSQDGVHQSGDFENRGAAFVTFAQRMFPRDPAIRKLGHTPERTPVAPIDQR